MYRSSKVFSRPDCIFEILQLWQSGFSRVYSNSCRSCSFEPEIIKIDLSSHKTYSNNILNFQQYTIILNICTKKGWKLIECTMYTHTNAHTNTHTHIHTHTHIYIYIYTWGRDVRLIGWKIHLMMSYVLVFMFHSGTKKTLKPVVTSPGYQVDKFDTVKHTHRLIYSSVAISYRGKERAYRNIWQLLQLNKTISNPHWRE